MKEETLKQFTALLDNTFTTEEVMKVINILTDTITQTKKDLETISAENLNEVNVAINLIEEKLKEIISLTNENKNNIKEVEDIQSKNDKALNDLKSFKENLEKELKDKLDNIENGKDGENGNDADEEIIIKSVLEQILQEIEKETGESIVDKINALSLEEENKIDASHIKNLPIMKGGKGGSARLLEILYDVNLENTNKDTNGKYIIPPYYTWDFLVMNWTSEPVLNTNITGGEVYTYILDGKTRYRYVPTTYNPSEDAFYSTFDGTILSNLIAKRG